MIRVARGVQANSTPRSTVLLPTACAIPGACAMVDRIWDSDSELHAKAEAERAKVELHRHHLG